MSFVLTLGYLRNDMLSQDPEKSPLVSKSIGFAPDDQEFPPPGASSGKLAGLTKSPTPSEYKPKIWATAKGA